jgi:hypothetical protein
MLKNFNLVRVRVQGQGKPPYMVVPGLLSAAVASMAAR